MITIVHTISVMPLYILNKTFGWSKCKKMRLVRQRTKLIKCGFSLVRAGNSSCPRASLCLNQALPHLNCIPLTYKVTANFKK